jgi:hypothetical protein
MRLLDLLGLLALTAIAILLIGYLAANADRRLRNRQFRTAPWRRTEFVDQGGVTHVVLRRSILDGDGAELLADNDVEIAAVPPGSEDFDDQLARARLSADLSAERMNYRRQ